MNKIATSLLSVSALTLSGFGIALVIYWVLRALEDQFGAGEVFGIAVGIAFLGWAAGVGWSARAVRHDQRRGWILTALWAAALIFLAYVALSTPGPPPVPVPVSVGAAVIGLALAGLAGARAAGRLAP